MCVCVNIVSEHREATTTKSPFAQCISFARLHREKVSQQRAHTQSNERFVDEHAMHLALKYESVRLVLRALHVFHASTAAATAVAAVYSFINAFLTRFCFLSLYGTDTKLLHLPFRLYPALWYTLTLSRRACMHQNIGRRRR